MDGESVARGSVARGSVAWSRTSRSLRSAVGAVGAFSKSGSRASHRRSPRGHGGGSAPEQHRVAGVGAGRHVLVALGTWGAMNHPSVASMSVPRSKLGRGGELGASAVVLRGNLSEEMEIAGVACGKGSAPAVAIWTTLGSVAVAGLDAAGMLASGRPGQMLAQPRMVPRPRFGNVGLKVVRVSLGEAHAAFLCDLGRLFTAGDPSRGRLGRGEYASAAIAEVPIPDSARDTIRTQLHVREDRDEEEILHPCWVDVSCGDRFCIAVAGIREADWSNGVAAKVRKSGGKPPEKAERK